MKDVNRGLFLLFVGMIASEIIELISGLGIGNIGTSVIAAISVSSQALTEIRLVVYLLLVIEMLFLSRIKQPRIIPFCIGALELLAGLAMFAFPVQFINAVMPRKNQSNLRWSLWVRKCSFLLPFICCR